MVRGNSTGSATRDLSTGSAANFRPYALPVEFLSPQDKIKNSRNVTAKKNSVLSLSRPGPGARQFSVPPCGFDYEHGFIKAGGRDRVPVSCGMLYTVINAFLVYKLSENCCFCCCWQMKAAKAAKAKYLGTIQRGMRSIIPMVMLWIFCQ